MSRILVPSENLAAFRTTVKNNLGIDGLSFFDHTCLALNLSKPSSASLIDSLRKSEEDYKGNIYTYSDFQCRIKIFIGLFSS
jgi:hypothetical protein